MLLGLSTHPNPWRLTGCFGLTTMRLNMEHFSRSSDSAGKHVTRTRDSSQPAHPLFSVASQFRQKKENVAWEKSGWRNLEQLSWPWCWRHNPPLRNSKEQLDCLMSSHCVHKMYATRSPVSKNLEVKLTFTKTSVWEILPSWMRQSSLLSLWLWTLTY